MRKTENKFWNNLDTNQRKALLDLANDASIIIKPADKGGAIVIMNSNDYSEACLNSPLNTDFYEELPNDANPEYKAKINDKIDDLLSKELINDFEASNLKQGSRTPHFYGLPKIHKEYITFLPLRPSAADLILVLPKFRNSLTPTLNLLPRILHPTSRTHQTLLRELNQMSPPQLSCQKTILATMDVSSLYPNIDHEEGVKACEYALNKRKTPLISTSVLTGLIMTVLKSNTLKFGERFFHQIKGTAMGTPMAVNFGNLFMTKFETEMLADYKKKLKKLPTVNIDDIFFTWDYDETSLKHFINFCSNYSSNQNMKSNITFTADYSTSEVYFLDTKIKFKGERLISELYSKPTASFQYLHRASYHPPHTFHSILKSQFIRIRHICSDIDDYWFHAERFSSFFRSRGFKLVSINKIINDIAKTPRQTLFKSQMTQIPTFF